MFRDELNPKLAAARGLLLCPEREEKPAHALQGSSSSSSLGVSVGSTEEGSSDPASACHRA